MFKAFFFAMQIFLQMCQFGVSKVNLNHGRAELALRCTNVHILPWALRALMVCLNTLTVGLVEKREGTLAFAKTFCFAAA